SAVTGGAGVRVEPRAAGEARPLLRKCLPSELALDRLLKLAREPRHFLPATRRDRAGQTARAVRLVRQGELQLPLDGIRGRAPLDLLAPGGLAGLGLRDARDEAQQRAGALGGVQLARSMSGQREQNRDQQRMALRTAR